MTDIRERALIVEDCRTVAALTKLFVQRQGFEVLVAADGLIGLEMARRELPRVILTDFYLPGMDGPDLVRALRADAATRGIAVFMLTSEDCPARRGQAMDAGVDEYILKPWEPQCMAALLQAVVSRTDGVRA